MRQQTYLVATCNSCGAVVNILEEFARDTLLQKLIHKIDCCRHPVYRWDKEFHFGGGFDGGYTGVLLGTTGMLMESVTGTVSFGTPEPVNTGFVFSGAWAPVSGVVVSTSGNVFLSPVSSALTPVRPNQPVDVRTNQPVDVRTNQPVDVRANQPMESRADVLKVDLDDSLEDLVDEKKERMERVIQGVVQGFW